MAQHTKALTSVEVKSLKGIALKGQAARAYPGEVFDGGSTNGETMVLRFKSQRRDKVSSRKYVTRSLTRFVILERVEYGHTKYGRKSEYAWHVQRTFVTEEVAAA